MGFSEYFFDLIYITVFIQVMSILSDKFWYIYLVIPGFAFYKLWQNILQPFFFNRSTDDSDQELDAKTKKKMEKAEKKSKSSKNKVCPLIVNK